MRRPLAHMVIALFLAACAAPDPVVFVDSGATDTGEAPLGPSIRILYPEVNANSQVELELDDTCSISQLFVFDVDDFELEPAAVNDDAPGQGHIHLTVGTTYQSTDRPSVQYNASKVSRSSDLVPEEGQFGVLTASLQENNHTDLDRTAFPDSIHSLEYVVVDPSGNCL